jgi:hypothetical protein
MDQQAAGGIQATTGRPIVSKDVFIVSLRRLLKNAKLTF